MFFAPQWRNLRLSVSGSEHKSLQPDTAQHDNRDVE